MNELLRANVRSHARRYLATGLAVAISMAFVAIALAFSAGMDFSLTRSVRDQYAGAAAVVTANDSVPTDEPVSLVEYVAPLSQLDGVSTVGQEGYASWELRSSTARITGSVSIVNTTPFPQPELESGALPRGQSDVALTSSQAAELNVRTGDTIHVRSKWDSGPTRDVVVSGIVRQPDDSVTAMDSGIYVAPEALPSEHVTSLLVALTDPKPSNVQQEELVKRIHAEFGDAVSVRTANAVIEQTLEQMQTGQGTLTALMMVFPVIALAVAAIVVSTTFQIVLQQRRRELALLRTLGARAKQVRSLVLRETAIVGAVASFLGVVLGVLVSAAGLTIMNVASSFGAGLSMQKPIQLALVWVAGTLITLAAGARPAMGVARIPPIAALAPIDEGGVAARKSHRARLLTGIVIAAVSGVGLAWGIRMGADTGFLLAFLSGIVCLIGALLVVSVLLPRLAHGLGSPGSGVVARMARNNTLRNPERTASTGTAIVIGVTLIATMSVAANSMRETLLTEVDTQRPFDLVVTSTGGAISPGFLDRMTALDGVDAAVAIAGNPAQISDDGALTLDDPASPTQGDAATTVLGEPDLNAVSHSKVPVLSDRSIEMNEEAPAALGLDVTNGRVKVCSQTATCVDLEVAWNNGLDSNTVSVSASTLESLAPDADVRQIALRLTDADDATDVQNDITSMSEDLDVGGAAAERAMYTSMINAVLLVVVGLLAVSVLVALVGVTNTLSLSVAERTRENGLLRALGLTRRQMQRTLALEAIYVALTSALVGVVLGVAFGVAGTLALPVDVDRTVIVIPWLQIAAMIVIAIIAALVASWWPGRRASHTSPVVALAAE